MIFLINQVLLILFVFCVLVVVRHVYNIIQLVRSDNENKYVLGPKTLVMVGLSVAYIITGIINGIFL